MIVALEQYVQDTEVLRQKLRKSPKAFTWRTWKRN